MRFTYYQGFHAWAACVTVGVYAGITTQIIFIALISVAGTFSAVSGVGNGIRIISEWNIYLSIIFVAFFLFAGPTEWLKGFFFTTIVNYLWNAVPMGFWVAGEAGDKASQGGLTIFYWSWWISWAPFVGMFIARISRGRTIQEFMVGVMFVPTTIAFFWLCIFGGKALYMEIQAAAPGGAGLIDLIKIWTCRRRFTATLHGFPIFPG